MALGTSYNALPVQRFTVKVDKAAGLGYPTKVEGGHFKAEKMTLADPTSNVPTLAIGNYSVDPLSMTFSGFVGAGIAKILEQAFLLQPEPTNGVVSRCDPTGKVVETLTFNEAWLSELSFSAYKADGKEPASMTVKLDPTTTETAFGGGGAEKLERGPGAKLWQTSNFKCEIDGLPTFFRSVELPTFTQKIIAEPWGHTRHPVKVPGSFTCSDLKLTIPLKYRDPWQAWAKQVIHDGEVAHDKAEKGGIFTALAPNLKDELFHIEFKGCSIMSLSSEAQTADGSATASVVATLYVTEARIKFV